MRVRALAFLLWAAAAAAAFPVTYYVDFQNGNDASSGLSRAAAWRTIPGTLTADGADWASTSWGGGVVANLSKVPAGTTFLLRGGSVKDASSGGAVYIDDTFYADAAPSNPISFLVDAGWGSGAVVFDGTGLWAGVGLVLVRVNGVLIDGGTPGGIVIRNGEAAGLYVKERAADGAPVNGCVFRNIFLTGNGTDYTSVDEGTGDGQVNVRYANGITLENIEMDGAGIHINGMLLGDSHKSIRNATVTSCTAYNHAGSVPPDDCGIGFKAVNGEITFRNCLSWGNLKGFDLGEDSSDNANLIYKVISCTARNNAWGINLNGALSTSYTGIADWYVVNCVIQDNSVYGSNVYSGPYRLYMVHNTFSSNGGGGTSGDYGNLMIGPNGTPDDPTRVEAWLYNNIFYKPAATYNYVLFKWVRTLNDFDLHSDYNCWRQRDSEPFALWDWAGGTQQHVFSYADGPGSVTTGWYTLYDTTSVPLPNGSLGHFHNDAHSVTGEPPFKSAAGRDYALTARFAGFQLSLMPWYIPEMGVDRNGKTRNAWSMGAYEGTGMQAPPPPTGLRLR
jgi:hypothetical protein